MATTQSPMTFCSPYPMSCTGPLQIRMPFGLPQFNAPDLSCEGASRLLDSLNQSVSMFMPIAKLAACVLKLVTVVKLLPGMLGPPPKIKKLVREIQKLADCALLLGDFSGQNYIAYCRMIRDVLALLLCILQCVQSLLAIVEENQNVEQGLRNSGDPDLILEADCLGGHTDQLKLDLNAKISQVQMILTLINTFIEIVPGLSSIIGTGGIDLSNLNSATLATFVSDLRGIVDVLAVCG